MLGNAAWRRCRLLAAATFLLEDCVLLVARSVHASVKKHKGASLASCWPAARAAMPLLLPQRVAVDCIATCQAACHLAVAVCRRCWWATLSTR